MSAITPNLFAIASLIVWPLIAIVLYRLKSIVSATLWTILGGQLLLPSGTFFKFPMVPQLDKSSIPSLCVLLGCMVAARKPVRLWRQFGWTEVAIVTFILSPVVTSVLNSDPIVVGRTVLPGVGIYDGLSAALSQFVILIPFLIGRQFFLKVDDVRETLNVLATSWLFYSVLLLFEIRFSPQLHAIVYGYYPTDFIQSMREDSGYRPMAFMGHGLLAGFFTMTALVASAALWRQRGRIAGINAQGVTLFLGVVLLLCKSGAAIVYGFVLAPLVRWTSPRFQLRIAVLLASLALLYPALRALDLFPNQVVADIAKSVNEARASSLVFRFDQEEELLQRASERPWFGWGRFGRSRVFKEDWRGEGVDTSVTDGRWVITFGVFGAIGFLAEFGLLAIPVFCAARAMRLHNGTVEAPLVAAVGIILAANMIDLLPNSSLTPWTWLLGGVLLGYSERVAARSRATGFVPSQPLMTLRTQLYNRASSD